MVNLSKFEEQEKIEENTKPSIFIINFKKISTKERITHISVYVLLICLFIYIVLYKLKENILGIIFIPVFVWYLIIFTILLSFSFAILVVLTEKKYAHNKTSEVKLISGAYCIIGILIIISSFITLRYVSGHSSYYLISLIAIIIMPAFIIIRTMFEWKKLRT
ncbi:MAG: hypothetical protein QXG00_00640 [Candidatus Woesearchaeota archaeon]